MESRRHHFVPQGFLRGFAADAERVHVWVYDKRPGRRPLYRSIKSIAFLPSYYATEKADGTPDHDSVEKCLARAVDNETPPLLHRIRPRAGERVQLTAEERSKLAFFVGLSMTRVPSFRDGIDELNTNLANLVLKVGAERNAVLRETVDLGGTAAAKPWASLQPMVDAAQQIATSILGKCWQFFVPPPAEPLPTCDNPVVFSGAYAGLETFGPAHPYVEIMMPLRSDLALVCSPRDPRLDGIALPLSAFDARKFGRGVVRAARHRVFFSRRCDSFDAFVKKYDGQEQRLRGD